LNTIPIHVAFSLFGNRKARRNLLSVRALT
jgi:hypothetical protein